MKMYPILLPLLLVSMGSAAHGAQLCHLDQAQAQFNAPSRDGAAVKHLLQGCVDAGSTDYRTYMMLGVVARDQHQLDEAAKLLEKAHALAPQEPAPALELALTYEWSDQPAAARALYNGVLAANPASRPAMLGLARIDRSQYRFEEASHLYRVLLQANPQDVDARNGLASIALANRRIAAARTEFRSVLKDSPNNADAVAGLAGADKAWRYQLDLTGGLTHSSIGTAGNGGINLLMYLDATDALELGALHNSNELPSIGLAEQTLLPSDDLRIGYSRNVPLNYHWALTYDYRHHSGLPSEHWLQVNVGSYFADGLQWFLMARESFGAAQWNNQLVQLGLNVPLTESWDVAVSGYYAHFRNAGLSGTGQNYAINVDLEKQGPGNSFFAIGAGYNPDIDNTDLHARFVVPATERSAFLFSIERTSINNEIQATAGWRFFLQ